MKMRNVRHRLSIAILGAALALLALPASAASTGMIVVHGPDSSSHLELRVVGGDLVVHGFLSHSGQIGCGPGGRHAIECPLAGEGAIEIEMGPAADLVQVLDPLPVPLTVHLGGGSDKFIGNSEPDTCYTEGANANGCFGAGGNDRCIVTGGNSECFGGPGNDFCRGGRGSDGCWGGPGNDVCRMGPGEDGCHGGPGNDRLYGGPGADQLYGGPGFDYCDGGPGVGRSHGCEAGPGH